MLQFNFFFAFSLKASLTVLEWTFVCVSHEVRNTLHCCLMCCRHFISVHCTNCVIQKVSPEPPLTKGCVGNLWNINFGWTFPLTLAAYDFSKPLRSTWLRNELLYCHVKRCQTSRSTFSIFKLILEKTLMRMKITAYISTFFVWKWELLAAPLGCW